MKTGRKEPGSEQRKAHLERLPQEFKQRMERMLGHEYEAFLASYEKKRRPGLRLNALKEGSEKLPGSGIDFDRFGQVRGDYCRGPISFMKAA